jgi:signal transduction histidine kinase/ActR/RegA family two-component response regulator
MTSARHPSPTRLLKLNLQNEYDVVAARQRARQIAVLLGFNNQDQVRIATAVSEIARNAFRYAGSGSVEFFIETTASSALQIVVRDSGPGIDNLQEILDGHYQSATGLGMGIIGTMRLMDDFHIDTNTGGTAVTLIKILPPLFMGDRQRLEEFATELAAQAPANAMAEVQLQNQELLQTMADLRGRQEELVNLTRELEDTNRGVVALYAELDEKAGHLRRADEMKSRFLSNMSHEFRTPVGSIRALAQLLLDRVDGELTEEQEKQVRFIQNAAVDLAELVNDLLDLAKIEAGKIEVRPQRFSVAEMFSALRGMLRPLLISERLDLTFDIPEPLDPLLADEGKISQILRNFISNALKFTEAGSIRVEARTEADGQWLRFSVTDTGIGIASEDIQIIFEEFSQLENPLQRHVKGTGLGLPLCRRLAELLGGRVEVQSSPGAGSTFSLLLPYSREPVTSTQDLPLPANTAGSVGKGAAAPAATIPVLVVEDHYPTRLLYEKFMQNTRYRPLCAANLDEAEQLWRNMKPRAVLLDIMLEGEESWPWLTRLKRNPANNTVPVIVVSELAEKQKGMALGADFYYVKPLLREDLLGALKHLIGPDEATDAPPGGRDAGGALHNLRSAPDGAGSIP